MPSPMCYSCLTTKGQYFEKNSALFSSRVIKGCLHTYIRLCDGCRLVQIIFVLMRMTMAVEACLCLTMLIADVVN